MENITSKSVSFPDFICTFAMPCCDFCQFLGYHAKISAKSGIVKFEPLGHMNKHGLPPLGKQIKITLRAMNLRKDH